MQGVRFSCIKLALLALSTVWPIVAGFGRPLEAREREQGNAYEAAKTDSTSVRVLGRDGSPIKGCKLVWDPSRRPSALTGSDGRAVLPAPPGAWVEAYCPDATVALGKVPPSGELVLVAKLAASLAGRVVYAVTGQPAAGLAVCLEPVAAETRSPPAPRDGNEDVNVGTRPEHCAVSGPEGAFTLEGLQPGLYELVLTGASVWKARSRSLQLREGQRVMVELATGKLLAVTGTVISSEGKPLPGARLALRAPAGKERSVPSLDYENPPEALEVTSDADGSFRFPLAPVSDDWVLEALAEGHAPLALALPDRAEDSWFELRLARPAKACGTFHDEEGEPVEDVSVEVTAEASVLRSLISRLGGGRTQSLADGRFCLEGLPASRFRLSARADGFLPPPPESFSTKAGERKELGTVLLSRGRSLRGRVRDEEGRGLSGAQVRAVPPSGGDLRVASVRTSQGGSFELTTLWPTLYRIEASKEGYCGSPSDPVLPEPHRSVELTLRRCGGLEGRVRTYDGGPVPPYTVSLHPQSVAHETPSEGPIIRRFKQGEARFRMEGLRPGRYALRVLAARYPPVKGGTVQIKEGSLVEAPEIVLQSGLTLRGRVLDSGDEPVAGAEVSAWPASDRLGATHAPATAWSDADGAFELEGLGPGRWFVRADYPGLAPGSGYLEIPEQGNPAPLVLRLSAGGGVAGTVLQWDRSPFAGAQVDLELPGMTWTAVTDSLGRYAFERVPVGQHRVVLWRSGPGQLISGPAEVLEGQTTIVDFRTGSEITLELQRGGTPVPGAQVALTKVAIEQGEVEESHLGATNLEGRVLLRDLQPGTYTLSVWVDSEQFLRPLDVPEMSEGALSILLPEVSVSGRVETASDRRPIPGATVSWSAAAGASATLYLPGTEGIPLPVSASTAPKVFAWADAEGAFRLHVPTGGPYVLEASAIGYLSTTHSFDPYGSVVVIQLSRSTRLEGQVVGPSGRPIQGALVAVVPPEDPNAYRAAQSGPGGSFAFENVAEGPALLMVWYQGLALWVRSLALPEGSDARPVEVSMTGGGELDLWMGQTKLEEFNPTELLVKDEQGIDIVLWSILLGDEGSFLHAEQVGDQLHVRLPNISAGSYRVWWRGSLADTVTVQEGMATSAQIP